MRRPAPLGPILSLALALSAIGVCAFAFLEPEALFAAVGVASLAIVAIPWLLQPRLEWTSPWAMVILSVLLGSTCTGLCVSLRWPDAEVIDATFRMDEPPSYFVAPCLCFLLGLAALTFGYYCRNGRRHPRAAAPETYRGFPERRLYIVLVLLLIASGFATRAWIKNTGGMSAGALSGKRTLVIGMQKDFNQHGPLLEVIKLSQFGFLMLVGHLAYKRRPPSIEAWALLAAFFIASAAVPFLGSRRQPIMWLFIGMLMVLKHSPTKVRAVQVMALAACGLAAFQFMTIIRGKEDIGEALDSHTGVERIVQSVVLNQNMADLTKTSHVINEVGQALEQKYGETFLLWLVTPVPRSVWPDKPIVQMYCLEVGADVYGQQLSGIPPGLVAEMYWNFRLPGVIVGSFLFGWVLRWTSDQFGIGRDQSLPSVLLHVVGPMRMGFDAVGHSLGYGFFTAALNTAMMLVLLTYLRQTSSRRPAAALHAARSPVRERHRSKPLSDGLPLPT